MRDTRPQKESANASASSRAYRKAEATPTATAPALTELAGAALAVLGRDGVRSDGGGNPGDSTWRMTTTTGGIDFYISCSGPDLPGTTPDETAHPTIVPQERPWVGTYRLVVAAPLTTFDIYWRADAPLRIMAFSRGDWEAALRALAG